MCFWKIEFYMGFSDRTAEKMSNSACRATPERPQYVTLYRAGKAFCRSGQRPNAIFHAGHSYITHTTVCRTKLDLQFATFCQDIDNKLLLRYQWLTDRVIHRVILSFHFISFLSPDSFGQPAVSGQAPGSGAALTVLSTVQHSTALSSAKKSA